MDPDSLPRPDPRDPPDSHWHRCANCKQVWRHTSAEARANYPHGHDCPSCGEPCQALVVTPTEAERAARLAEKGQVVDG